MTGRTLLAKLWDAHLVRAGVAGPDTLFVDLHLVQEVSSPQAFEELRLRGLSVRRPDLTLATVDHSLPTTRRDLPLADLDARVQIETLSRNCRDFGVPLRGMTDPGQGIVHVIAPETGLTQPGMTIVCGDSHTSTHGAFGALAFGIGTSEIAHVLATQCLLQDRPRTLLVRLGGNRPNGVGAKDLILWLIARGGTAFAAGHAIEYAGPVVDALTMEERMTVCNMSIEGGGRIGMIAPDATTYDYLAAHLPPGSGTAAELASRYRHWRGDPGAIYDRVWNVDVSEVEPAVSWGTTPAMTVGVTGTVPRADETDDPESAVRALAYMGLTGGERITDLAIDRVFIGSCTNGRIEDLRAAAAMVVGRRVAVGVSAMVVPGSSAVGRQAEAEGLVEVFRRAGFDWRNAGCSMCVAMNADRLEAGQRCASTTNRNFEGRQGTGGRTHLVSPAMAAGAAIAGHFVDVRELGP